MCFHIAPVALGSMESIHVLPETGVHSVLNPLASQLRRARETQLVTPEMRLNYHAQYLCVEPPDFVQRDTSAGGTLRSNFMNPHWW